MANPVTLSNNVYDKLKQLTQIGLPALGSLYFGLSEIWGFPAGDKVVGSIALLTTFCGAVLGLSSKNYQNEGQYDGQMVLERAPGGGKLYMLNLNGDPEDLDNQDKVTFKVVDKDQEVFENREWK